MPCLAISASTTAYGRKMIMHTRELVMQTYTRANGWVGMLGLAGSLQRCGTCTFRQGGPQDL